ncbi:Mu transposase C-terminal domain-containing protein [Nonomuraea zeae]|uniref:Mu transposase C-terminal domain-containing protein n=1 Tax=Nonomuraea zeae TaxID=1642303 RepID=UPI0014789AC6|nr:Mu transposase C-terminal domain-containing protein [Nonomuraea zeae]
MNRAQAPRPPGLHIGDRIIFENVVHTVVGLAGTLVRIAAEDGNTAVVHSPHLMADPTFEHLGGPAKTRLPAGLLHGLAEEVVAQACWWEQHVVEILTGVRPDAPAGTPPRPEFDPARHTLRERDQAKALELAHTGREGVSLRTVERKRQRYQAQGLAGLIDGRHEGVGGPSGRVDPLVVAALTKAIEEATDSSPRTASYFYWKVGQVVADRPDVRMPSRATFYRLFDRVSRGRHITGSARTRRSLASRPEGPFSQVTAFRPGEWMEIDSTPLDVLVVLDDGVVGRVELTGMVDLATRTVTAGVLRPSTKSVDATLLLARTVTPELMRPGWAQALSIARSVLPYARLMKLDERLEHAAARPVIVPETIVCDKGKVFISANFRTACRMLGISLQPAHPRTGTDKQHIERTLESVATLFAQFVSGYTGRSAEYRGRAVGKEPLWPLHQLQDLLDEWLIAKWQNRPHDGLRDPLTPGQAATPNEKYAALVEAAGYVPVPLSGDDYIELLPAGWRAINAYGVKINHRIYDDEALKPLRNQPSGVIAHKDLWEVHHDPYDVSRVWVRNHHDGGWITAFWRHLHSTAAPFGEMARDHAREILARRGQDRPTEEQIAQVVNELLTRAGQGPESADTIKDRKVRAQTLARTDPSWPRPTPPPQQNTEPEPLDEDDEPLAEVIPLGVFDAHEEAKR